MSAPRLYHVAVPGIVHSRTFRCIWLLEELGVDDFEICMLNPKEPYAPQMRKYGVRHSHKLPTLQLDDLEVGESGVISQLLAERYEAQCPLLGTPAERLERMQWMAMAETCITLRIPLMPALMNPGKGMSELRAEVIAPMRQVFHENVARFEAHFEHRRTDFLLASGFSIADTMCGWSLHTFDLWGLMAPDERTSPRTHAYLERLRSRSAFQRAERFGQSPPGIYALGQAS